MWNSFENNLQLLMVKQPLINLFKRRKKMVEQKERPVGIISMPQTCVWKRLTIVLGVPELKKKNANLFDGKPLRFGIFMHD